MRPKKNEKSRVVCWFSCGAASAVAAKLAMEKYSNRRELVVAYCDTLAEEHPDNARFMKDAEGWLGVSIVKIKSLVFNSVSEVFFKRKFMSNRFGAQCTIEMKKKPRFSFQRSDDINVFGFTFEEWSRAKRFEVNNPELITDWVLVWNRLSKQDCLDKIASAGIEIPVMYRLGYKNNNCIGCVKAQSPAYWNKIKEDFPDKWEERRLQSRQLGSKLVNISGQRFFIDDPEVLGCSERVIEENLSCGPQCGDLNG